MKTTVGGLEMFQKMRDMPLDTAPGVLRHCPFCGHEAAFEDRGLLQAMRRRVVCSNTSCGVATPWHYMTREKAAEAWNRRASSAPGDRSEPLSAGFMECGQSDNETGGK